MDILHLKYVAEIARTGSMTQAAANLYMTQPNLSRAVRELESELHITIFSRSSRGATLTRDGRELLLRSHDLLVAFDHLQARYKPEDGVRRQFGLSGPRAGYLACAFAGFVREVADAPELTLDFRETSAAEALEDVVQRRQNMAIVRYPVAYENYYRQSFRSLGLFSEVLLTFDEVLIFPTVSPLREPDEVTEQHLRPLLEIVAGDEERPGLPAVPATGERGGRRLRVCDRASALELAAATPQAYFWGSRAPEEGLARMGLAQRAAPGLARRMADALVHPKDYRLSLTDQIFLKRLYEACLSFPQ